jgi:hypothetical protein
MGAKQHDARYDHGPAILHEGPDKTASCGRGGEKEGVQFNYDDIQLLHCAPDPLP